MEVIKLNQTMSEKMVIPSRLSVTFFQYPATKSKNLAKSNERTCHKHCTKGNRLQKKKTLWTTKTVNWNWQGMVIRAKNWKKRSGWKMSKGLGLRKRIATWATRSAETDLDRKEGCGWNGTAKRDKKNWKGKRKSNQKSYRKGNERSRICTEKISQKSLYQKDKL